jgi:PD-(D/E)XK nuclease superfamily
MNKNFFSAIQGKFKADFQGRYLGNILEHIAVNRIEVIEPLLKVAPLENRKWKLKEVDGVTTEVAYLSLESQEKSEKDGVDRRADLAIQMDNGKEVAQILIEIKVNDGFLKGQLEEYIDWAKKRNEVEDRAVVFLTAFPLTEHERKKINENSRFVHHFYLSELTDKLHSNSQNSELIALFVDYLCNEGYAMFNLFPSDGERSADYDSLLSFLVLQFLPHESGHGKVSNAKKIIRGPVVFGSLVQNWQQVSDRLADLKLGAGRRPTIRYFPEQGKKSSSEENKELSDSTLLTSRKQIRKNKQWGRFWLTADTVLADDVRIEWGQIIEIQHGNQENEIDCSLYVIVKRKGVQRAGKFISLKDGIKNKNLYSVEKFMDEIFKLMSEVKDQALREDPDLSSFLEF